MVRSHSIAVVSAVFASAGISLANAGASSLRGAMHAETRAGNATGRSLDSLFISDGAVLRFWNDRFGSKACLDHGPAASHVGAYPCDDHGGNQWTIECPGDMAGPYGCERMRLTNYRFGEKVCLDHHRPNEVDAFPCTGHGGDIWGFEITGQGDAESGGQLRLFNARFGEKDCLDHHGQDGTVAAYPCDNHGGDEWFYDSYHNSAEALTTIAPGSGDDVYFGLVVFHWAGQPNTCMDVAGGRSDNFNKIQVWACESGEYRINQQFYFDQTSMAEHGSGQIRWGGSFNKCLDVKDGSIENFADVVLCECHDSNHPDYAHQLFSADYFAAGSTHIRWGSKCLDLKDGIVGSPYQSNSKIVTYDCHAPSDKDWVNQQWNVKY